MNLLFIFAQPRSGSTLLQRLINCDPGFKIFGEHIGILRGISQSWKAAFSDEYIPDYLNNGGHSQYYNRGSEVGLNEEWTALRNGLSQEYVRDMFRKFIQELMPIEEGHENVHTIGFKEIRYARTGDFTGDMILELFPESKILFLYRDPVSLITSQAGSGYFPGTIDDRCSLFIDQACEIIRLNWKYPLQTDILNYNHLKQPILFDRIGSSWTSRHDEILNMKIGATDKKFKLSLQEMETVQRRCTPMYKALLTLTMK